MAAVPLVEASCPSCGLVSLPPTRFSCGIGREGGGCCEFTCPACQRTVFLSATGPGVRTMWEHGARTLVGPAPFELFEAHDGPPLTWDDILDFHFLLVLAPAAGVSDAAAHDSDDGVEGNRPRFLQSVRWRIAEPSGEGGGRRGPRRRDDGHPGDGGFPTTGQTGA